VGKGSGTGPTPTIEAVSIGLVDSVFAFRCCGWLVLSRNIHRCGCGVAKSHSRERDRVCL